MSLASAQRAAMLAPATTRGRRAALFKHDRPRAIDRYIDYFGSGGARGVSADPGGETLLEILRDEGGRDR